MVLYGIVCERFCYYGNKKWWKNKENVKTGFLKIKKLKKC